MKKIFNRLEELFSRGFSTLIIIVGGTFLIAIILYFLYIIYTYELFRPILYGIIVVLIVIIISIILGFFEEIFLKIIKKKENKRKQDE